MQGEKQKPGLYLQQRENILVLNQQISANKFTKKIYPLVRRTAS